MNNSWEKCLKIISTRKRSTNGKKEDLQRLCGSMESDEVVITEDPNSLALDERPVVESDTRSAFNQHEFRERNHYIKKNPKNIAQIAVASAKRSCRRISTLEFWCTFLKQRFPILHWLWCYNIKQSLLCDVIAGLTVGVMHIPQGMAYAMLANVPPVLGLYVSFFPVLIYVFMGTSKHISIGTFAVICLMLSKPVEKWSTGIESTNRYIFQGNDTDHNITTTFGMPENVGKNIYSAVEVVMVVCFLVGLMQILMSILSLGSLSVYLSDTLISGFTTGAAVHVLTSQVKNLFGLQIPVRNGMFKIIYTCVDMFVYIKTANYVAVIFSSAAIALLWSVNQYINPRMREKFKVPLPMELLVIIFATLISYFMQLKANYQVNIISHIPTGLPSPHVPPLELIPSVAAGCFAIAVVCFTITMSMAKLFANKHKYEINANQELLAMGIGNVFSSFFSCFPSSASLSRSLVQESTGGKTQVAGLVSCIFLLVIILAVGPLFESLPNCILSSIIVVALLGMFKQFKDLKAIWNVSKLEGMVWLATFFGVVITDVDLGLVIGLIVSFMVIIIRTQRPSTCLLGYDPDSGVYLDVARYQACEEEFGVKIFRFGSGIYYANRGYFCKELYRLIGFSQSSLRSKCQLLKPDFNLAKNGSCQKDDNGNRMLVDTSAATYNKGNENVVINDIHHVILDASMWDFIDMAGIDTLVQVIEECENVGIKVLISACPDETLEIIEGHCTYFQIENRLFPSNSDAKAYVREHLQAVNKGN